MTIDADFATPATSFELSGDGGTVDEVHLTDGGPAWTGARYARLKSAFDAHFDFVWRTLRGLGVGAAAADDAAQQVYCVFSRKLESIEPEKERAFLVQTAVRVASNSRRTVRRQREVAHDDLPEHSIEAGDPEELLVQKQRYEALERLLDTLPDELRVVFVLFELEGFSSPSIATLLGLPRGTVASRLRRARAEFSAALARLQETAQSGGHP